jgi:UDP-2-acetamido-3-amino-2,3-dideoxy-glucuronate N-acetyltransferase
MKYFKHKTAIVDKNCKIGSNCKIWHWSHISKGAKIGKNSKLGQNVYVGENVIIGSGVKIQNNVSIFSGVEIEDNVFCGPSVVFTNIKNPRSEINQKKKYIKTLIKKGVTIGANSTIICGVTLGEYCFIGAGSVVTKNVPPNTMFLGNPAKFFGRVNKKGILIT